MFIGMTTHYAHADFFDDYVNSEPHFLDILDDSVDNDLVIFNEYLSDELPLRQLDPDIIVALLDALGATEILQNDFFLRTNPLTKRSILDLPLFELAPCKQREPWTVGGFLFFNKTDKYNLTRSSTRMCSYLALASSTLIDSIEAAIDDGNLIAPGNDFTDINVRRVFEIAQDMRVEERNLGLMFYFMRQWKRMQLRLFLPFLYHERNLFLTNEQLDELADEFGSSNEDFREEHSISDRLGFGDTRIELAFNVQEKPSLCLNVGLHTTLPTAFTIAKEFYGTTFPKPGTYPDIDFEELYKALDSLINNGELSRAEQKRASAIVEDFFLGSIDRFAANLIDDELGNHHHFSIGSFVCADVPLTRFCKRNWAHNCTWSNRVSLEYLFPKDEKRFFINKNDPAAFEAHDFTDPMQGAENLAFFEQELINKFYLLALDTNIQPELIFRWTSKLVHTGNPWSGYFGTNL